MNTAPSTDMSNPAPVVDAAPVESMPTEPTPASEPVLQTTPATVEPVVAPAKQTKSRKVLVIAGLILVVVGIVLGGILYFISQK
jgi:hypothetical protein